MLTRRAASMASSDANSRPAQINMACQRRDHEDDILRNRLEGLGEDVGPINDSTRYLYQKKLSRLVNGSSSRSLGHLSSDDSDADSNDLTERRRRRWTKRTTPDRSSERLSVLQSRDTEVTPLLHRFNNSLLVHRASDSCYPSCVEERGHSHWVSAALVITVALFFVFLGAAYMGVRSQKGEPAKSPKQFKTNAPYNSTLCEVDRMKNCVWKASIPRALKLSDLIQRRLQQLAGQFECGEVPARNMTYKQCLLFLQQKDSTVTEEDYKNALLLLSENPTWGIMLYDVNGAPSASPALVQTLEAIVVGKSFICCLRMAFYSVLNHIIVLTAIVFTVGGMYYGIHWYSAYKEHQRRQLYDLVEKITTMVREHADPFVAQVHVRDMVIAPSDRQRMSKLWQRAVSFLEQNESRIRTERQHIEGESYVVWRWLPGGGRSRVWQGRAFETGGSQGPRHPIPATCLKIRNMFDPDVEDEADWSVQIQNAILEKCQGNNGIVHMRVDTSSKEGCVYIKCSSLDSAGQAYRALHGSWFDGNLITVKYLRLERYHERFPEAQYCREPLQPSNALRLSLAKEEEDSL
ncbi:inner nuclear membrane protein Man1-like [Ornithodoros turicata]|uniref:inner nuclear membrane protein Man1-like n=1 Tax=Ornithodoros turicata TaxID=34597 RepID=UPI003138F093